MGGNTNMGLFGIINTIASIGSACVEGIRNAFYDGESIAQIKKNYEEGIIVAPVYRNSRGQNIDVYTLREVFLRDDCGHVVGSYSYDGPIARDYTYDYIHKQFIKEKEKFDNGKIKEKAMVYISNKRIYELWDKYHKNEFYPKDDFLKTDPTIYKHYKTGRLCYRYNCYSNHNLIWELMKKMINKNIEYRSCHLEWFYVDIYTGEILDVFPEKNIWGNYEKPSVFFVNEENICTTYYLNKKEINDFIREYNKRIKNKWKLKGWEKVLAQNCLGWQNETYEEVEKVESDKQFKEALCKEGE